MASGRWIGALVGALLAGGSLALAPSPAAASSVQSANVADRAFARLADRWLSQSLRLNPIAATQAGEHRYDMLLPDPGPAGRAAQLRLARSTLAALGKIDRPRLSRPAQVDAAVLENQLRYDIFQIERLQEHAWNPLIYTGASGSSLYLLMAREFAPLPQRLRSATRRMEQLPAWLAAARRELVPGRVPLVHAETAVRQNAGLDSIIDDMILPEAKRLPAAEQARLRRAATALKAASKAHGEWLKNVLVPAAKGEWRLGRELYDQKLSLALNSPISRPALRRRAERVITDTRIEMYGLARQVLAGRAGAPPLPARPTEQQQQAAIAAALDLAAAE